jgi:hypothetical protein
MKQYHIGLSDRFAAVEKLYDNIYINMTWKSIREKIKTQPERNIEVIFKSCP